MQNHSIAAALRQDFAQEPLSCRMMKPMVLRQAIWRKGMEANFPLRTRIARRLLGLHAMSCSTKRNWFPKKGAHLPK